MAEIIVTSDFLKKSGGEIYGDISMSSGVSFIPEFSGSSYLGDIQHPFSAIYTDAVIGKNIMTKNVVYVKQNPNIDEFSSIASAAASITDANPYTNPYTIYVGPGIYNEPEIILTAGMNIVGMDEFSVIIQPISGNNVLNMQSLSSASYLTIRSVPSGYYGTIVNDPGEAVFLHKVMYENCYNSFISTCSGTSGNQLFLEYVNAMQDNTTGTAFQFIAPSGSDMTVNLQNWFVRGNITNPSIGVLAQGQGLTLRIIASALLGVPSNTGIGLLILEGANAILPNLGISNWSVGVQIPPDGYSPNIQLYSVSFNGCSTDLIINNPNTTGFSFVPIPRNKLIVDPVSPFYIVGFDPYSINVSTTGGDYTNIIAALQSINTTGPTSQYIINVGPGIFVENNPIILKPYVSIVGFNSNTSIIEAQNPNEPLFEVATFSNLQDLTLVGTTGNYLFDFANNNAFAASGYMTVKDCYVGSTYGIAYVHPQTDNSTFLACLNMQALPGYSITQAFKLEGYQLATLSESAIVVQNSLFSFQSMPASEKFLYVSGTHATIVMDSVSIQTLVPYSGSVCLEFLDGPQIRLSDVVFDGYETGMLNQNYGSGSLVIANGFTVVNSKTNDIVIANTATSGAMVGIFAPEHSIISGTFGGISTNLLNTASYSLGSFEAPGLESYSWISGSSIFDSGNRVISSIQGQNGPSIFMSGTGNVSISASGGVIEVSGTQYVLPENISLNTITIGNDIVPQISGTSNLGTLNVPFSGAYINSVYAATVKISGDYTASINDTNILTNQIIPITIGLPITPIGKKYFILSTIDSSINYITVSGINCNVNGSPYGITVSSRDIGAATFVISDGYNYYTASSII